MKVIWEMNTENPVDQKILNALGTLIKFVSPEEIPQSKATGVTPLKSVEKAPAPQVPVEAEAETETAPPKKRAPKKRAPKEKSKEQLMKLPLVELAEYLKARKEHSLLDCRILAKGYIDGGGTSEEVINVLHTFGANSFDDLKNTSGFVSKVIKLVEDQGEPESNGDDLLGL